MKTGGRKAGTLNKVTKDIRLLLKDLINQEIESFPTYLSTLSPKDRMEVLVKILPYVLPKQTDISFSDSLVINIPPKQWAESEKH